MISVGGRDERKRLELGFADMDGSDELEEGEACSFQNQYNDDDTTVDLDVALSYIDKKLQDVLGQFQKEFEGGVSAEKLGAKFDGYGSFLPTYQRSPVRSHRRNPAKVDECNTFTCPNKLLVEDGVQTLTRNREASMNNIVKQTGVMLPAHRFEVPSSKCELVKSFRQKSDEKILKATVNMGSDSLSSRKNAKIYNGLGLDVSPSSSGESLGDSGGLCHEREDVLDVSASRILQIMTSFLLHENQLLSPLTENLINLTVNQKKFQGNCRILQKVSEESSSVFDPLKSEKKYCVERKSKALRKDIYSVELKNLSDDKTHKDHDVPFVKEIDIDTVACEKLFVDDLKLPLLSNSYSNCIVAKDTANEKKFDANIQSNGKSKCKVEKADLLSETESNVSEGRKTEKAEFDDENVPLHEDNGLQQDFSKEHSPIVKKEKLKGSEGHKGLVNSVSKNKQEYPKLDEDRRKKVDRYKDFFGEMELDLGDNDVDSEKSCSDEKGKDDADTSKFASTSTTPKVNVKKMDKRSTLEAYSKSVSDAAPMRQVLPREVNMRDGTEETNNQVSEVDDAQFKISRNLQAAVNNRSLNGRRSPIVNEVEPASLSTYDVAEEYVHKENKNDKLSELPSSRGDNQLSETNRKRMNDKYGSPVLKKIKMAGLHSCDKDEERQKDKECQVNGSHQVKSSEKSSLSVKEETKSLKSVIDNGKTEIYNSGYESMDCTESYDRISRVDADKIFKQSVAIKETTAESAKENNRRESRPKSGEINGRGAKLDLAPKQDQKQNQVGNSLEKLERDRVEIHDKGELHSLPPSGKGWSKNATPSHNLNRGDHKEDEVRNFSLAAASQGNYASEMPKQKATTNDKGNQQIKSRDTTVNGNKVGGNDAQVPVKKDSSSHSVSSVLKEAKDLKHLADRLKNTGSSAESRNYYFQAALKFLHGAALLESSSGEGEKQGETIQSMQIYGTTGKLCGFCGHEYEKSKDMEAAALAYKCMEVAYMRVVYSSRRRASRDRLEFETASQIICPGESPSYSASDVDNIINPMKGVDSSPQVAAGNKHIIPAGNRSSFVRLLNYAQDVNSAMEASKKCRIAFAAAKQRMKEADYGEGIASVKRALDFNFQDMEGLLRLVRLAMEAIAR